MPYVVPVDLGRECKALAVFLVLDLLGIIFTAQAFGRHDWRWFAGFALFTVFMFLLTFGQARFIRRVTKTH